MNYYNEFDKKAAAWLRELIKQGLIPDGIVDERSIIDVRADELMGFQQCHFFAGIGGWNEALRLAGIGADERIWTGSCPCQAFSTAGKQKGFKDKRDLWPAFFELIKACKPERVFGEQVGNAIKHGWLDRVYADLEGENYTVGAVILGAHSVGAPHQRQRLYWGGVRVADCDCKQRQRQIPAQTGREYFTQAKWGCGASDMANDVGGGLLESEGTCNCDSVSNTTSRELGGLRDTQGTKGTCAGDVLSGELCGVCDSMADGISNATRSAQGQGNKRRTDDQFDNRNGFWNDDRNCGATSNNAMDDCISEGLERHTWNGDDRDESGRDNKNEIGPASEASNTMYLSNNHWSDFQLIYCRDGKVRRVPAESVFFGVADGVSDCVDGSRDCSLSTVEGFPLCQKDEFKKGEANMLLKGYGNAIVPEVAAEFLKAWMKETNQNSTN